LILEPKVFSDDRGFFLESYNQKTFSAVGIGENFVQDNHSYSKYGVLRGLHCQPGMGKLVSVLSGRIFDVAVDIRPNSRTYGKWKGVTLDARSKTNYWIPDGFLHGFQCISPEGAHVVYKCSAVYDPSTEFGVNPFDEEIGVQWPIPDKAEMIISERDQQHPSLGEIQRQQTCGDNANHE